MGLVWRRNAAAAAGRRGGLVAGPFLGEAVCAGTWEWREHHHDVMAAGGEVGMLCFILVHRHVGGCARWSALPALFAIRIDGLLIIGGGAPLGCAAVVGGWVRG